MVSMAGLTRSNGSVSQAGKCSTASAPSSACRSLTRRSASAVAARGHHDRAAGGAGGEPGHHEGARRLGHRQHRVLAAEHGQQPGLFPGDGGEVPQVVRGGEGRGRVTGSRLPTLSRQVTL